MGPQARRGTSSLAQDRDRVMRSRSDKQAVAANKPAKPSNLTQQRILDIFKRAFPIMNEESDFKSILQDVKGHLYNRDFQAAFGKREHLEVYAARWSAARALAYTDIFANENRRDWFRSTTLKSSGTQEPRQNMQDPPEEITTALAATGAQDPMANSEWDAINVVCIGGGAGAELVALATISVEAMVHCRINVCALDIADWNTSIQNLYEALTTPPQSAANGSQDVTRANSFFTDPDTISVQFLRGDVLETGSVELSHVASKEDIHEDGLDAASEKPTNLVERGFPTLLSDTNLVTIMFTLNELFATSLPKTTSLLLRLTDNMRTGSHLVVVDSPGSYSEIKLGKTGQLKKYPMKWLLDHTLLNVAGDGRWKKIEEEDSLWFRLENRGKHLRYPIELENCRYQLHAYQKQ